MIKIKKNEVNKIINIESKTNTENIELNNTEGFFNERYYFTDYFDDAKLKKLIKSCEKAIRGSEEYSKYIGFLNGTLGLTNCAILGNVSKADVTIEMHHYPFTLYDIVYLNIMKRILKKEKINSFLVAREVLQDHYDNFIGLVPLSKTVHDLVHAGEIFVNLSAVYGDINTFVEKYNFAMSDDLIEKYNKIVEMSEKNTVYSETDILKKLGKE